MALLPDLHHKTAGFAYPTFFFFCAENCFIATRFLFSEMRGHLVFLCYAYCVAVPRLAGLDKCFSRKFSRGDPDFPLARGFLGMAMPPQAEIEQACETRFDSFVAISSPKRKKEARNAFAFLAFLEFGACSHNPEVVGSNPAPATKKS